MARRLCTIENTFLIEGRGLIPAPGIIPQSGELLRIGDPVLLKRPDGSTLTSKIGGIALVNRPPSCGEVDILLKGISKEDVQIGTEIWSVDPS